METQKTSEAQRQSQVNHRAPPRAVVVHNFSLLYRFSSLATLPSLAFTAMKKTKNQNQNTLLVYRRRMGFSQRHVAWLLGFGDSSMVSRYERGHSLPSLPLALQLGIVLRVPVEFLFPHLYDGLRLRIRAQEEKLNRPGQPTLFEQNK